MASGQSKLWLHSSTDPTYVYYNSNGALFYSFRVRLLVLLRLHLAQHRSCQPSHDSARFKTKSILTKPHPLFPRPPHHPSNTGIHRNILPISIHSPTAPSNLLPHSMPGFPLSFLHHTINRHLISGNKLSASNSWIEN